MSVRGWSYRVGRVMGDVSAVQHHRVVKRIIRRRAGRATGLLLRKALR